MTTIVAARVLPAAGAAPLGPSRVEIDPAGRIAALTPVERSTLSAEEARLLLIPALSDAHDHGRGLPTLAFGAADQMLETWLPELARQPRVDPYLNALVALARLAESGVCAVNHCHNTQDGTALLAECEAVSRAARDVGVSVAFAWPFFDRNPTVYGRIDDLLRRLPPRQRAAIAARERGLRDCATNMALMARATAFEHAGFRLQYHPVAPQWTRPETLAAIAEASARDGRRVHMHLLETQLQRRWADAAYPDGLIAWFDRIGLLSPRLTLAHAVWLRPDECRLLAGRGVTVSINLSSNLRLRSGSPPLGDLIRAGVPIAIGLDGMSLDDDQDMLREIRLAHHVAASPAGGVPTLSADAVLDGVWSVGRRSILGDDEGGRIAPGAPADLLAIDFETLSADCVTDNPDVPALLLGRATRRQVVRLMVAGRDVVVGGGCRTINLATAQAALIAQARAACRSDPPDAAAIEFLRDAVERHYQEVAQGGEPRTADLTAATQETAPEPLPASMAKVPHGMHPNSICRWDRKSAAVRYCRRCRKRRSSP